MKTVYVILLSLTTLTYSLSYLYTFYNYDEIKTSIECKEDISVYKLAMIFIYRIIFTYLGVLLNIPYTVITYVPLIAVESVHAIKYELLDFLNIFKYLLDNILIKYIVDIIKSILEYIIWDVWIPILTYSTRYILYILGVGALFTPCLVGIYFWGDVAKKFGF